MRAVCAALDLADSDVIKIAAVTAGSELYEISRASGAAILLQVWNAVIDARESLSLYKYFVIIPLRKYDLL